MSVPRRALDREIYRLALPALGALAVEPAVSLVDTAFVGRLDRSALAGLGVAGAAFLWAFFAFNFLSYATTPLVAGALGAGDRSRARRTITTALGAAVVGGITVTVILEAAAGPIVSLIGARGDVVDPALTYLRIRALATPAMLVVLAGHGSFRGLQDTRTPLLITVAFSLLNLVLDPVLMFGAGWGIAGAAWASVIALYAGAAVFVLLLRRRGMLGSLRADLEAREVKEFLRAGAHIGARTAALLATFTLATAVAARVGDVAIASHRIVDQVFLFLALSVDALAVAAQAMIGQRLGAGDMAGARRIGRRLLEMGAIVGIGLAAVLALLAPMLPAWFTTDEQVVASVGSVLWFLVLLQPLNAVVFVGDGVLLGWSAFRYLAAATIAAGLVASVVLVAVVPMGWGLAGVWSGITVLMGVRAAALIRWYLRVGVPRAAW